MAPDRTHRILVLTDAPDPRTSLRDALRRRAGTGGAEFRLVVLNPARAETHLRHPLRRDRAASAADTLRSVLPGLQQSVRAPVVGTVSVRHDPMDAIEEVFFTEPVDEIVLDVPPHRLSSWLHQDLEHRLVRLGIPVTTLPRDG